MGRNEAKVDKLEGHPEQPVAADDGEEVVAQLALDVVALALEEHDRRDRPADEKGRHDELIQGHPHQARCGN